MCHKQASEHEIRKLVFSRTSRAADSGDCTMQEGSANIQQRSLPGYGLGEPGYRQRCALKRHVDGRLLSGCGGDLEVIHPLELEKSQHTGMPVRVTTVRVFGGSDVVKGIIPVDNSGHVFIHGVGRGALIHSHELYEGSVIHASRIYETPSIIVAVDVERHGKSELLISFLLECGVQQMSLHWDDDHCTFQLLHSFKCTRPILSGLLWRDGGALHVAYYDGFVRVGILHEDFDDMLLIKRLSAARNDANTLIDVIESEVTRLLLLEESERLSRDSMLTRMRTLQKKLSEPEESEGPDGTYSEFMDLKATFRTHSLRADRISHRLLSLKRLLALACSAVQEMADMLIYIDQLEMEFVSLEALCGKGKLNGCPTTGAIETSSLEEKRWVLEELLRRTRSNQMQNLVADWDKKISSILDAMCGSGEPAKDMRLLLCNNIFEHRGDRNDRFTNFLLDSSARDLTLFCMSGLTTLAVYPRKAKRVASISLDASYETKLTCVSRMSHTEGVYVADEKGVFPIYFYRDKRYFDAGNPLTLPPFDAISAMLMEPDGMILGSLTGGLLHLAFDFTTQKYEHFCIASSVMSVPFSRGSVLCLRLLAAGDAHIAIHSSSTEIVISELEQDRWHRVTYHQGGAHCLAVTPFNLEHRGAFVVAGSLTYVRIKALRYTEDNLIGLHDMGESRVIDETGKEAEVLNISLDPSMEFRALPCKLRYAVGFSDKAIRTYVALLTGQQDFQVPEKFIAQIEPLHTISMLVCFHGRPMGCYAVAAKTLQVWNDLDRHQQKKMKSERMQLIKMESAITAIDRVEGRSSYLILGFKDSRMEIYEERGRGTGKLECAGMVEGVVEAPTVISSRACVTAHGDRLFVHVLHSSHVSIYTALVEAGKIIQSCHVLDSAHRVSMVRGLELMPYRPYDLVLYGGGVDVHRLSAEERKLINQFRDFEF